MYRTAEVADLLEIGRNLAAQRGTAAFPAPFFGPEEERSILDDRSVEVAAEVVVTQLASLLSGSIQKEVVGIQRVISQKLEYRAVKLVAAAFGDQIDHGALSLSELRAETVSFHAEFLDRVDGWKDQQGGIRTDVHVVDAVDGPEIGVRLVSVDRHIDVRVESGASRCKRSVVRRRNARYDRDQRGVV